jgi:N-acetylmuramoyl-L-alanine amidase/putative methionine-R-sulfoxide reductase with GAF domain
MSATPNNAGAAWADSPSSRKTPTSLSGSEGGQNALQALLAFAYMHEQASRRRSRESGKLKSNSSELILEEEQFALDEVLRLVAERAVSITGADGIAIALADDTAVVCRASFGRIAPDPGTKLDSNAGFSGACLSSGQTIRCDDSANDARVNAAVCRVLGARSMVAVPLSAQQRVIGLIEAFSTEPYGFNDSDVHSLNLLGELILAAIRPEEEDRLAELAARVVIPAATSFTTPAAPPPLAPAAVPVTHQPVVSIPKLPEVSDAPVTAPRTVSSEPSQTPIIPEPVVPVTGSLPARPRIIVDEKFPPVPVREAPAKTQSDAEHRAVPQEKSEAKVPTSATSEAAGAELPVPVPEAARDRHPMAVATTATLVLTVIGLGWELWVKYRHDEHSISAHTERVVEVRSGDAEREIILPAPAEVKPGPPPQVTGLRLSGDSSTVIVDLQDQVQYEAHSLDNPARIYFDLHDTKIAPGWANKTIDVNGSVLKRVRMAQPVDGVTRVVLDTAERAEFSVSLDPNPYRLTIEVHQPTAATVATAAVPVTLPKPVLPKPSPVLSSPNKSEGQPLATKGFQVVLDAGHGGWDLGTVGKKGLLEKDLVLDIVQRAGQLIESKLDAHVIYTRQDDSYIPLEKRTELANVAAADLFVSVHANYSDLSTARGVETFYSRMYSSLKARSAEDDAALKQIDWTKVDLRVKVRDSQKLAADIQQALCGALVASNPDLRNRGVKEAQYVVLTGTQMPAILAEVSFVSSPEDEAHLQSSEYRQRIANALYRGVAKYREESKAKNTKLASAKKTEAKQE